MKSAVVISILFPSSLATGSLSADLNCDGIVDFDDLARVAEQWLEEDANVGCETQYLGSVVTRRGMPYGPLYWFSFDGTLASIDGRQSAVIDRASNAVDPEGCEIAVDTPRYKKLAICNPGDSTFREDEWEGLWSLRMRCTAGNYLIAGDPAMKHIYHSADGFSWTQALVTNDLYYPVHGLDDGTLLLLFRSCVPPTIKRSTDLGETVTDVEKDGSIGFSLSLSALISYHSVYQADNGTVVMVEYGKAAEPKIYRSADRGASWTTVFTWTGAPEPSVNHHFHCVTKHEKLGWWIVAAGDGGNRTMFYSTDDGLTFQQMYSYNGYPFQPCYLLDYGHPTRLVFGSDMSYQIGIIEFDRERHGVASVKPVCFDIDRRDPYVWSLFYHEGIFYGGSIHTTGPENRPAILASKDLENWVTYARIAEGNGIIKFAGFAGGRIHCVANESMNHHLISPARIFVQRALVIEPGTFNLLETPESSSVEGDGSSWTNLTANSAGSISVSTNDPWHGSQCLRVWREHDSTEGMLVSTARVVATPNNYYTGRVWIRSPNNISTVPVYFFSEGQHTLVGTYVVAQSGPDWQEVLVPPYKVLAGDSEISLRIKYGHSIENGELLEHYIDGAQIQGGIPTSWHVGGTTRFPEKVSFAVKTPTEWTNAFIVLPESHRYFYDHVTSPCYIKSWVVDVAPESEDHLELYYEPSDKIFCLQRTVDGVAQVAVATASTVDFHGNQPLFFALRCSSSGLKLSYHDGVQFEHVTDVSFSKLCSATVVMRYGDRMSENVLPMRIADDKLYMRVAGDDELKYIFGR